MGRSVEAAIPTRYALSLSEKGRLIGIDQDAAAIEAATGRLGRVQGPGHDRAQQLLQYEERARQT